MDYVSLVPKVVQKVHTIGDDQRRRPIRKNRYEIWGDESRKATWRIKGQPLQET